MTKNKEPLEEVESSDEVSDETHLRQCIGDLQSSISSVFNVASTETQEEKTAESKSFEKGKHQVFLQVMNAIENIQESKVKSVRRESFLRTC